MTQYDPSHFFNRELSWIEFNQRVLDQAADTSLPLLERVKFLAITASNLDEFFMVRVGGLELLARKDIRSIDPSGMTPDEQLTAIRERTHQMSDSQSALYRELESLLEKEGIHRVSPDQLSPHQVQSIEKFLTEELVSIVTPIAIQEEESFPPLVNLTSALCVRLAVEEDGETSERFAILPLSNVLPRYLTLPSDGGYDFILLEDILKDSVDRFFNGQTVLECVPFRITRNADFSITEIFISDIMEEMEDVLQSRKMSHCVRLELSEDASEKIEQFLTRALEIEPESVYRFCGPVELSSLMKLSQIKGYDSLKEESWKPQPSPMIDPRESIFESIAHRDILLAHPYEGFEPVVRFIQEAAEDPDVLAIKQTLYRTSSDSDIVTALINAAEHGKSVTAVVELKARFDEGRNIDRARAMEQAGIHVIYGVRGLKTHSKICVVIRREPQGIRRYMHFGTGNYNESTAKLYSDISLMTCEEDLGSDAVNFFNAVTGDSQPQRFHKLAAAPFNLREKILEMIEAEISQAKSGQRAFLKAKLNSLVDPEIIESLYRASQHGVAIDLSIRGICCLKPGVKKLSEKIRVSSVIDRYLEHARIMHFFHGGDQRVFISSADWMPRNLDRRVELLVPVEDKACRKYLIEILNTSLRDNVKSRRLFPDGQYVPVEFASGEVPIRSQDVLYRGAVAKAKDIEHERRTVLEPYHPPGT